MKVYLVRHGMREDRLPEQNDEYEPLTEEGKAKVRNTLAKNLQLKAQHGLPTIFLTSRFRHAYETSEAHPVVPG